MTQKLVKIQITQVFESDIISLFLPGIGQVVQGETQKGIIMFVIALVLAVLTSMVSPMVSFISLIFAIYAAYDAYKMG